MQCPQCGTYNAPGQEVCARCGGSLAPVRADYGGPRYPGGGNEPVDGAWRDEWPALNGAPEQTPLPPWLSTTGSAPSSRMPSAPFTNGSPASQGGAQGGGQPNGQNGQRTSWDTRPAPPASAPFNADYPSQYPSYYGNGASGQLDQQGAPQQQMAPMFMVNPPEVYPPDLAMTPYGLPPSGPLSMPGVPAPVPPPGMPGASGRPAVSMTPTLSPGAALKNGRYRIIQRYSGGSSSSDTEPPLIVATDTELPNERVLIQELPLAGMHPEDAEYIRHGITERLDSLSQVAGIAHLRDSFVEQRRHFLVFELPSGDRLLDRLRRAHGPLPETTVIGIILQVLDILTTLERSPVPIIHGNITPANILLRPGGQVALVGFSPVLLIYPTGQVAHGPAGSLSNYSAPEQARGTADIRSDLYATCAVMHHAATGVEPSGRMFPLARRVNPAVSLELEDILGQGLRPSPGQRYQAPETLREALAPLASGKRLTHVDEELDPDSPTGLRPLRDAQGRLIGPRQRLTQNPLFFVGIVLVLVAILGGGVFYALQPHTPPPSAPTQTISSAFAPYYQSKGIGLSGGEFVFDTQQPDYTLKQNGALAMAAGDVNGAFKAYQAAVTTQPSDVEALIYTEDLQILVNKEPYVTVIAAVAFGADNDGNHSDAEDSNAARFELQGIYLAQQRFNNLLDRPGHLHMRVLILNSGKSPADAQLAASLMLEQIHKGNVQHIVGVIGWPESEQSRQAMTALGASGLPMLSPTASANSLKNVPGNFYSLAPSDSQQAVDLAYSAVNDLQAHRILVAVDPNDQQNSAMATSFSNQITTKYSANAMMITPQATYDEATMEDASAFTKVAQTALSQNADLIYLLGDHRAAVFLANEVARQATAAGQLPPHILVGPQSAMSTFLGIGTDPGALAARTNPDSLSLLYVTALASISQWQALNITVPDARAFSDSFATLFSGFWGTGGKTQPDAVAILAYDATNLLMRAVSANLQTTNTGIVMPTAQQMQQSLGQFNAAHPFVGLGGAVAFSDTNHQPNKALALFKLLPIPNAQPDAPVAQMQLFVVVGGRALFCGQTNCLPF